MESKHIIVAQATTNQENPTVITEKIVQIYGFSGSCSLNFLQELYPNAKQFIILNINEKLWSDIESYSSLFENNRTCSINVTMLEECSLIGIISLTDKKVFMNSSTEHILPIHWPKIENLEITHKKMKPTLTYISPDPQGNLSTPMSPTRHQMLTDDQVEWLTQQYLNACAVKRFYLDRHGNVEMIMSFDNTPTFFYPPFGDSEERVEGHHKIDLTVGDIWRHLYNCGETNKMPNEFIINQIICLGANPDSTDRTGSHWIVRSVRLEGLNHDVLIAMSQFCKDRKLSSLKENHIKEMLSLRIIKGLFKNCTLSYLNSASDKTSHLFAAYNQQSSETARSVKTIDIKVPSQYHVGTYWQKYVICGDLAAQNSVSYTIYGRVPDPSQYTSRNEHVKWFQQGGIDRKDTPRWGINIKKMLAEKSETIYENSSLEKKMDTDDKLYSLAKTVGIVTDLSLLEQCDNFEEANKIIADIRIKVSNWLDTVALEYQKENNRALNWLFFPGNLQRDNLSIATVELKSIIPLTQSRKDSQKLPLILINEIEKEMPELKTGKNAKKIKAVFDFVRIIEGIISSNINRLENKPDLHSKL